MKKLLVVWAMLLLVGCKKEKEMIAEETIATTERFPSYTRYAILPGQHYCDINSYNSFAGNQVSFKVKFDSSAIYKTVNPGNQNDVNKLYGFSEGSNHHIHSTRIGWAWSKNALRLYAYVYSDGIRKIKEITTAEIGKEISCSIGISGDQYLFTIDEITIAVGRTLKGAALPGYYLYPYFGGDEVSPHNIFIYIMVTNK